MEQQGPASLSVGFGGQRGLFREPQHASAMGRLRRGHAEPQLRSNRHTARLFHSPVEQPGGESVQPFFTGPNAIFNEPDSRYNDAQIPLINLLRPYPQFDGNFTGLPLQTRRLPTIPCSFAFKKGAASISSIQGSYTLSRATDNSSSGANG